MQRGLPDRAPCLRWVGSSSALFLRLVRSVSRFLAACAGETAAVRADLWPQGVDQAPAGAGLGLGAEPDSPCLPAQKTAVAIAHVQRGKGLVKLNGEPCRAERRGRAEGQAGSARSRVPVCLPGSHAASGKDLWVPGRGDRRQHLLIGTACQPVKAQHQGQGQPRTQARRWTTCSRRRCGTRCRSPCCCWASSASRTWTSGCACAGGATSRRPTVRMHTRAGCWGCLKPAAAHASLGMLGLRLAKPGS